MIHIIFNIKSLAWQKFPSMKNECTLIFYLFRSKYTNKKNSGKKGFVGPNWRVFRVVKKRFNIKLKLTKIYYNGRHIKPDSKFNS